jgi:RNA polymerase sigma-70 factor (ECF subfamily)
MTDASLIALAKDGDAAAIVSLYERYKQQLYRYLYYRLGDAQVAEDLTTEVFIRLIQSLSTLRVNTPSIQAWVYQIARNLAIDHTRKKAVRKQTHLHEQILDHANDPVLLAERRLNVEQLYQALQQLTDEQREVVLLRFINGHSIAEVAQMIEKSESAVKNLQIRALKSLHRLIAPEWVVYG